MRKLLSIPVLFLCFVSLASAQSGFYVDPSQPAMWFTKGTQWGRWTKSVHFPGISWRAACGDGTKLGNVVVYKQQTQVRNDYDSPTTLVWAVEAYNQQTGKNTFLDPMQQDFDASGKVSGVLTVMAGQCAGGQQTWIRLICATPIGQASKCYQSNGQPYAAREPDQLMPSADQKVAGGGVTNRSASSQAGSSAASSEPPPEVLYNWCADAIEMSSSPREVDTTVYYGRVFKATRDEIDALELKFDQSIRAQFGLPAAHSMLHLDCRSFSTQQEAENYRTQNVDGPKIPPGDSGMGPKQVVSFKVVDLP